MKTNTYFSQLDVLLCPIAGLIIIWSFIGLASSKAEAVDPPTPIRNAGVAIDALRAKISLLEKEVDKLKNPQIELDPLVTTIFVRTVYDKFGNKIYEGAGQELFDSIGGGKWDICLSWKDNQGMKRMYGATSTCSFYTQQRVIKFDSSEIIPTTRKPLFPYTPPASGLIQTTRD